MSEEQAVDAVAESPEFILAVNRYADGTTADHQFIREIVAAVNKVIPASSPMRTGNLPQMDAQGRVKVAPSVEAAEKERCAAIADKQADYYGDRADEAFKLDRMERYERFDAMRQAAEYIAQQIRGEKT